jgi:exopolyphosphatase/pppGpp-phosphohydrolase
MGMASDPALESFKNRAVATVVLCREWPTMRRPSRSDSSVAVSRIALLVLAITSVTAEGAHAQRTELCAIDMGSNTFRRIVGSFEHGRYEQRSIEKATLGVGDDLARHGRISDEKLTEIEKTLARFRIACEKDGASRVVAIGTSAFREAPNGVRAAEIAGKLGIPVEIATERRESELAYLVGSLGQDGFAVIDNGSRSIELVSKDGSTLHDRVFDLGYRVAYEQFFAAADAPGPAVQSFRDRLSQEGLKAPFMKGRKKLVGVEFGEMVDVLFKPAAIEGRVFTLAELKQRLDQISASSVSEFQMLKKQKDIDRALPRLVVAAFFTEAFGYSQLELTERELGSGLIIEAGLKKP